MRLAYTIATIILSFLFAEGLASAQSTTQNTATRTNQHRQPTVGQSAAQNNVSPVSPMAPEWYATMTPEHHKFLDELLDYWQTKSDAVKRYQCDFVRYDYDTTYCNWRDPKTNRLAAVSYMTGEIRFAAPDRASYETMTVYDFALNEEKQVPDYNKRDELTNREKWICDGKAIHEFDFAAKRLYETEIPVEMRGKGLINSPLPFLFGASKEDILNRFWVRVTTPNGVENEYWLEAVPKKIDDARNYKKLDLVLSRDELFLPIMLHVYAPNYDPKQNNMTSRVFEFKNRQVDGRLTALKDFFNRFVRPSTPIGFERVKRKSLQARQQFAPSRLNRPAQLPGIGLLK